MGCRKRLKDEIRRATPFRIMCLLAFATILLGCVPGGAPEPKVVTAPTANPVAGKPAWEQEWDRLVAGAKKEQKVSIGTTFGSEARQAIAEKFKERFGIDLEFTTGGGSEFLPKITAERRAGLYTTDLIMLGLSAQTSFKEPGFLDSLESVLLLPEVLDPKAWIGGGVNIIGKDKYALTFFSRPALVVAINTDLVKPEEIKSYRDLLNPRWKGKIVFQDPTVSGAGNLFMTALTWELMGQDYFRELARQEPIITRDKRVQVEWLARGKYPITIAPDSDMFEVFDKEGTPIKAIWPVEGAIISAGKACLSLLNKAPHPAGARVFTNWLLTREGQTTIARAAGGQSARLDVVADWVEPERRVQPGYKYVQADTEESAALRVKTAEIAKEIFGHLLK